MGEEVTDWTPILEKHTTSSGRTELHILNTKAIHAKLRSGDQHRITNNLDLALSTLRTTLILPTTQEHIKHPKITTHKTQQIHTSWLQFIKHEALPLDKHTTYETITSDISLERRTHKKQGATHKEDTYMTPCDTIHTPYDVIEIQDHRHLNNQSTYLVTQRSPEILTQVQINACTTEGFQPKHIHPIMHQTDTPTCEVHWQLTWQLESTITKCDSGLIVLAQYKQRTQTQRR